MDSRYATYYLCPGIFFRLHQGCVSVARFLNKCFPFLRYNIAEYRKKQLCSLILAHLWDIH